MCIDIERKRTREIKTQREMERDRERESERKRRKSKNLTAACRYCSVLHRVVNMINCNTLDL